MNQAALYSTLPNAVMKNMALGVKEASSNKDSHLMVFLQKTVARKRHSEFREQNDYKYYRISLTGARKKVKDFVKTPSKRKQLTAREKRDLKLVDIPKTQQRYEMYIPLHELWKDYMRDLIRLEKLVVNKLGDCERKLLKADYHGAEMTVTDAKCTSLIGQTGIVLMETKHTFKFITKENNVKVIPKKNTVFVMELDGYAFKIYGSNFQYRPADRSARKFKGYLSLAIK